MKKLLVRNPEAFSEAFTNAGKKVFTGSPGLLGRDSMSGWL